MKADTPDLMKFKRLMRRLGVSVPELCGYLELLWRATSKNAPEGDIGRFSNEDIAIACYWDGDANTFVESLVECGWLDESEDWRLLVHDWPQHAPTYVHGFLKRHGRSFRAHSHQHTKQVAKQVAKQPTESSTQDAIATSSEQPPSKSSQVKSNQVNPSEVKSPNSLSAEFYETWERWRTHRVQKFKPLGSIEEDQQLMELSSLGSHEAELIVSYSISRGAINLITNGDHKKQDKRNGNGNGSKMQIIGPDYKAEL